MFTKGKYIWLENESPDTYGDFITDFTYSGGKAELCISADSHYVAYINGSLAAFGQYADYPDRKIADTVDVTGFVKEGVNHLAVIVWYFGETDNKHLFTYAPGRAGLIFEVSANGAVIAASNEDTLSRSDPGYKQGRTVNITSMIGADFYRDQVNADDRFIDGCTEGFGKSRVVKDAPKAYYPRPNKKLLLGGRAEARLVRTAVFTYPEDAEDKTTSYKMDYASLTMCNIRECTNNKRYGFKLKDSDPVKVNAGGNIVLLLDLGAETVGFLDLDIEVPYDCRIDIGWGEHIYDGMCRTSVRNFAVSVDAKAGRNTYMNPFRRFGGRYVQLFIHANEATVYYAGIRPTDYPLTAKKYSSGNLLRDTIYDVCCDTLRLCLHEHYEDCPWREQSLYALDSRNQMLCGYYAFGEFDSPRASLHLLGESLDSEGLISICAPMRKDSKKIPSFSLAYFIQMNEYIKYSGDTTLAAEMYDTLEAIVNTFVSRIDESGLVPSFGRDGIHWNFYEWSDTLCGDLSKAYTGHEAMLNFMLVFALKNFAEICCAIGKNERAEEIDTLCAKLTVAAADYFWDADRKLMHTSDQYMDTYTVLVNAMALLVGAFDGRDASEALRIITYNGKDKDGNKIDKVIGSTLSMNCFRYDALLAYDRDAYRDIILSEIDEAYFFMLRREATSFWETLDTEQVFGGAESLCHGWSALPIYYYEILK